MNLIISAGDRQVKGFVHHDIRKLPGIDIVCDLFDLPNHIKPKSCDLIHFTHALEHFPTSETNKVLTLIHGLLRPGGKLYIEVPNFAWHAQLIQEGRDRDAVYYAFGGQLDEYDFHKTGFTPKILEEELMMAGFKDINIQPASSISATAVV
jgi:predicted SAM-dependent methyltransferase